MTKAVKFQALNTFKPYAVFYRTGGQIEKFHFINGWGASVANHDGSYGGDEGLYELAEINPLAILKDGTLMALDGKVMTDDNSNFRHNELQKYLERSDLEERAEKSGFSLVELDGNIAVIGNGAGLVMSTFDMLADSGGKPACFLDVGGGATE